jgi:ribosomal protein L24E
MHVVRMDDAWFDWRPDGMALVRTDGTVVRCASERDGSIVRTADREPKSSQS